MFDQLTRQFDSILRNLRGLGKITDKNIQETSRMVRRVLLEADVNFQVARTFIDRVRTKAEGTKIIKSIKPGEKFVKIIHDELVHLLGKNASPLACTPSTTVVLIAGLQGSGKTTACAKLAKRLKDEGKSVLLVAADVYRPAAIDQLNQLGKQINIEVFSERSGEPVKICKQAVEEAKTEKVDVVILDTAGRLHVDGEMMVEIQKISDEVQPSEILFVVDGMTGQDAVNSAQAFSEALPLTGTILTKMDGDSRGGAAVSITEVTGKPIKFMSTSEKIDALDVFEPERIADQILGFGDAISLVKKAEAVMDLDSAKAIEKKIFDKSFDLEDFLTQIKQLRKMGPLDQLLGMLPSENRNMIKKLNFDNRQLVWTEAIIKSMTQKEREIPHIINGNRRQRIAKGSGRSVQEVNHLLKQFSLMQRIMKKKGQLNIPSLKGGMKNLSGLS